MSEPTFDEATLRRLHEDLGAEAEVTRDILQTFLTSTEALVAEARAALAARDRVTLMRVAHTLKSGAATVGAARLAELAKAAEARLAAGGEADEAEVEEMARELDAVRPALLGWRP